MEKLEKKLTTTTQKAQTNPNECKKGDKRRKKEKYVGMIKLDPTNELNNTDRVNELNLPFKTQR